MAEKHGGARKGAGRKPGSRNERSKKLEQQIAIITGGNGSGGGDKAVPVSGQVLNPELMPLEYMLSLMRDEDQPKPIRMLMAEKAAPYCHAKLSAVEALPPGGIVAHEEALKALR